MTNKEKFIEKSIKKHSSKYDYSIVNYISSDKKVEIICKEHGIFKQAPYNHIRGQGCPTCAGVKKHTKDEFINIANNIHNNKFDYSLVEYKNNKTNIKIICKEHGVFETRPDNHINNKSGCPKCANNILYTNDDFIKKAEIIHNKKFDYSKVDYKTAHTKIIIICPIHGEFKQKPANHLSGDGCSKCSGKYNYTTNEFIEKVKIIHNNKYDYSLVDYINCSIKIKIICPIHGLFEQNPSSHLKGIGCENCKESKGEKTIQEYLDTINIKYIRNKKFDDCKHKHKLPFDFYLPDYNICIEYDGIQHFESVEYWGGKIALEKQIIRDKIKTDYCLNNNIKLIRIKYNEDILDRLKEIKL